jgi:hypothetical protein
MFDSHSELAIPGESHFIPRMARERSRYERPAGFAADAFVDDLRGDERFLNWRLPPASAQAAVESSRPSSLAEALRAVYAAYAAERGKPRYGDKTPGYVRELPLLADLFPEARFVHLVRDGRDVVLSLRERPWGQRGGLETLAAFWRTNVERAFAARRRLGRRYCEIRYEELIDDPEPMLNDACAFLELDYEPEMLSYHERAGALAESLGTPEGHRHLALPPTSGLRDWRAEMSVEELTRFELVAGDALEQAGYRRAVQ